MDVKNMAKAVKEENRFFKVLIKMKRILSLSSVPFKDINVRFPFDGSVLNNKHENSKLIVRKKEY